MSSWGSTDFKQLEQFRDKLAQFEKANLQKFCRIAARELAARLLRSVIPATPVGQYPKSTGKVGGTLRRGWTANSHEGAAADEKMNATAYADSLPIEKRGDRYEITIINPVEYASYVEFGHRTRNGSGWVNGKFMLTKAEARVEGQAQKVIEKHLMKALGDALK